MFKLTFHRGSLSGETLNITTPQVILGRSQEHCDVWLNDDGMSRVHCRIEERDDGIYVIDLNSRNGTWVNRQRVSEQKLASGDVVHIGSVKLTFEVVEAAVLHDAAAETNAETISRRSLSLASLLAFLRTSYGGILVGLSVGTGIALLLLFLLPEPRKRIADSADTTPPLARNAFANNTDFSLPPPERNNAARLTQALLAPQEQVGQNDPDPPKADNEPPPERKDSETPHIQGEARIVTGFDSSYPRKVQRVGENHFTIDMRGPENNFFLFKIEGAAGKKIRVDLINLPPGYAPSLNPVYSYVKSLDDLECLAAEKVENPRPLRRAKNGPPIPDTSGQNWHYIENVSFGMARGGANPLGANPLLGGRRAVLGGGMMSFEETFEQDTVFVSMRFPYTYGYNEAFLKQLKDEVSHAAVWNVGESKEGRNLWVLQVGDAFDKDGDAKPTVVIYGREHGNEQDSSIVAEGAIRFLVSDNADAVAARTKFCFLIIPLLDPDGAVAAKYDNIADSFTWVRRIPEALAYAEWFKNWMDSGKRLDMVINLHNVRSAGFPHLFSPMMERGRLKDCLTFHTQFLMKELKGFQVSERPSEVGYSRFRFGGWLEEYFSPLYLAYEINSQSPSRHLAISELRDIGSGIVRATVNFLADTKSESLRQNIAGIASKRADAWIRWAEAFRDENALVAEEKWRKELSEVKRAGPK